MPQKLSPTAKRDKAARDLAFAKTPARKAKKAHAQRERRDNPTASKGKDYDHKRQAFVSVKSNRGNEGDGTKRESGNNYRTK
jgi:AMMECR1 domain-containing protein